MLEGNKIKVSFGTRHPAILALALQQADLQFKEMLLDKIVTEEPVIHTAVPTSIIDQL